MYTCLTVLQNLRYGLDVYTEGCALFHFPGIGSLILRLLAGLSCGEYGFRMNEHLKYSEVPVQ